MTSNSDIVHITDIHLGFSQLSGKHVYDNLIDYLYPHLEKCKLLLFSGDTFHTLLDFNHPAAKYVVLFLNDLFNISHTNNLAIRFLRGTYTHDRNQVSFINGIAKQHGNINFDIKCYDVLSLDFEKSLDLRMLYIPDDLGYSSSNDCIADVHKLLNEYKWENVDVVVGHGYFKHVLPPGIPHLPACTFDMSQFTDICTKCVLFGHVHTPSITNLEGLPVIYGGSFERMNHGEEEAKGFVTIDTSGDKWKYTFVENKNTILFKTYTSSIEQTDDIIIDFKEWITKQNLSTINPNHIRVKHDNLEIRQLLGKIIKAEYPEYQVKYSHLAPTSTSVLHAPIETLQVENIELVIPTELNVIDLIEDHITNIQQNNLNIRDIRNVWDLIEP